TLPAGVVCGRTYRPTQQGGETCVCGWTISDEAAFLQHGVCGAADVDGRCSRDDWEAPLPHRT
ncbi:dual-specificity protein phosphatase, partial [Toxoplasma gondii TgCatPRC2]